MYHVLTISRTCFGMLIKEPIGYLSSHAASSLTTNSKVEWRRFILLVWVWSPKTLGLHILTHAVAALRLPAPETVVPPLAVVAAANETGIGTAIGILAQTDPVRTTDETRIAVGMILAT